MRNEEIIGLAKNRWLPKNVQVAIAKHHYARAHCYLAENEGLDKEARDYLWSDECNKGYALKSTMISYGQYNGEPEKYWELYERYPGAWTRSAWRMSQAFFGNYWYSRRGTVPNETPVELLHRIYDDRFDPRKHSTADSSNYQYGSHPRYHLERLARYHLERLAKHPNIDLELAIKLSQCGIDSVQRLGFNKIVELS